MKCQIIFHNNFTWSATGNFKTRWGKEFFVPTQASRDFKREHNCTLKVTGFKVGLLNMNEPLFTYISLPQDKKKRTHIIRIIYNLKASLPVQLKVITIVTAIIKSFGLTQKLSDICVCHNNEHQIHAIWNFWRG